MKNRIKLTRPAIKSRLDLEDIVRAIADLTLERNIQQTNLDQELTSIRAEYEATLTRLSQDLDEKVELVRAWAEANPDEFKGLKSLDLVHGVIGWRTGQPTLKTLTGWTWDRVLEKLKAIGWFSYVRSKEEVNKQQILAERETIAPENLRNIGVKVVQAEAFYVEPKLEELENRQTVEA
ncbi:MAG: host-nuclease inhibitor Gam family protein [Verrucomicrobiia bacterium]